MNVKPSVVAVDAHLLVLLNQDIVFLPQGLNRIQYLRRHLCGESCDEVVFMGNCTFLSMGSVLCVTRPTEDNWDF